MSDAVLAGFTEAARAWFVQSFAAPTPVQAAGWARIAAGEHALLLAPTGSGKTLAAFFWGIDRLLRLPVDAPAGVRLVYVSPLKALVYDIERNLRAPLVGCLRAAERLGHACRQVRVDLRTGDTAAADRRHQLRAPADILVTTPESLYLMLGGQAAATLTTVHTVIVDEIHALAPTKRGVHLALSLERLAATSASEVQRIGLSATVRPHGEVARYLGGDRTVAVVDCAAPPQMDLSIEVASADMEAPEAASEPLSATADGEASVIGAGRTGRSRSPAPARGGAILGLTMERPPAPASRDQAGIWARLYPRLLAAVQAHRATIVFVNSRSLCERMAQQLNDLAGAPLVRAHHGSLAPRQRAEIEESLKDGRLRGIVATSSLELGIDMGHVDLVVQVASPGSVARGLQRIGRAGHAVGARSRGILLPKFRADLLECAVIAERMQSGELEPVRVPTHALDVLAQQLVAMCVREPQHVDALWATVRRAAPYRALPRAALVAVLEMLAGSYPSDDFAELRPLLAWDRATDVLTPRRGARLVAALNGGTIADRGMFGVFLVGDGPRVGELDEEMVHESRRGDVFALGASSWRVEEITRDRVLVSPAPGEPGRMPFWRGEGPGRPIELGRALGAFVRELDAAGPAAAAARLGGSLGLDAHARHNLLAFIAAQRAATGTLPTDRRITVERFRDELGDWRVCILTPFGARVHAPWALALEAALSASQGFAVQAIYRDDGIVLRFADGDAPPALDALLLDPATVEEQVMAQLAHAPMFASAFRENAGRALLLPRRLGRGRSPLWQQRLRAKMLLATAQRYPSFPIVLETYRECLQDVFDLPALTTLLAQIQRREVAVDEVETATASPFARGLAFAYVAAFLYEQDAPSAERRAQALTLDRELLRELMGQAHLRELLDPAVLDAVEATLQGRDPERPARDLHEVHDLLRRLGDLDEAELQARSAVPVAPALQELQAQRRAVRVRVAGQARWIAAEDAGCLRDALGTMPPAGLPAACIAAVPDALTRLLRRYARTHGPFVAAAPAQRFGLAPAQLTPVLAALEAADVLVHGEMRPGGTEPEWCDAEVLRRLKRATLAHLRRAVAALPAAALGHFLPRWQGCLRPGRGSAGLAEAVARLEGMPLPWSALSATLLPQRVADFHLDGLDMLCAMGSVVWVGAGALGPRDGRVRLLRRAQAAALLEPPSAYDAPSPAHAAVLAHLQQRGACFTFELVEASGLTDYAALEPLLWDLVWAGQITNDTVQPLRGLQARGKRPSRRRGSQQVGGRWSCVAALLTTPRAPTERALARAHVLLQRYGIVSREAAAVEDLPGGFSAVYGVLKELEEAGQVRRGYFVEGLAGAQFAYAGAIEQLRADSRDAEADVEPEPVLLATLDPACPFGALLPWPERPADAAGRPRRAAGAWTLLWRGLPLAFVEGRCNALLTFAPALSDAAATAALVQGLRALAARRRGGALHLHSIDGAEALRHPRRDALVAAGMAVSFDGLTVSAEA